MMDPIDDATTISSDDSGNDERAGPDLVGFVVSDGEVTFEGEPHPPTFARHRNLAKRIVLESDSDTSDDEPVPKRFQPRNPRLYSPTTWANAPLLTQPLMSTSMPAPDDADDYLAPLAPTRQAAEGPNHVPAAYPMSEMSDDEHIATADLVPIGPINLGVSPSYEDLFLLAHPALSPELV